MVHIIPAILWSSIGESGYHLKIRRQDKIAMAVALPFEIRSSKSPYFRSPLYSQIER